MKAATASPLLAFASVLAFSLLVSAAPAASQDDQLRQANTFGNGGGNLGEQIHKLWSAFELWVYRLLHGGRNPPGWGVPVSSSSSVVRIICALR